VKLIIPSDGLYCNSFAILFLNLFLILLCTAFIINLPLWRLDGLSSGALMETIPSSPEKVTPALFSTRIRKSPRSTKSKERVNNQVAVSTDNLEKGTVLYHLPLLVGTDTRAAKAALRRLDDLMPDTDGNIPRILMRKRLDVFKNYLQSSEALNMSWNAALEHSLPQGIVITAGGRKALLNAFSVINIVRNKLKCNLPIVMAFWGDLDMSPATRSYYSSLIPRLEFLDMSTHPRDWPGHHVYIDYWETSRQYQGYKLKIWSIYLAPFRQVLYLDADNTPITDPSELFDIEPFKKHGSLFW
jgi:hypothetical protein